MNVEGVGLMLRSAQLATQIFIVNPEPELIGVGRVVPDTIIDVVVGYAGARSKGNLTAEVRKQIQAVVMVMLRDGQLAVQDKPVDQVRQLAQSSADALRWLSLGDGQALFVAFSSGGPSYEFPY